MKPQFIFVYNADSGLFNSITDFAHKIISPSTYNCNLCALTYGNFIMRNEWKTFIQQLSVDVVLLHKDEFQKVYNLETKLPVIFIKNNDEIKLCISDKEINNCKTLQQLEDLITSQLAFYAQHHYSNI